ncbi:hypothetical protein ACJ2A9_06870 [Anaerobacillus sp. MEB173]|uniref:hypothetical protein n=1 Tax=Anaerobacillus sp. MEB173 TaxID=3383345 RepID=UPI003F8DA2BB
MSGMEEIISRILGFMPQRSVFWTAVLTSTIIIVTQYVHGLLNKLVILPWMKPENQKKRQQLLQKDEQEQ